MNFLSPEEYGVGFAIENKMKKFLFNVIPISSRIIILQYRFTAGLKQTFINIYAPHATKPKQEKEVFYDQLRACIRSFIGKGPPYFAGGF